MAWLAVPAVIVAWLVPQLPIPGLAGPWLPVLSLACPFLWCLWGPRVAIVAAAAIWVLVRGSWIIADRVPAALLGSDVLVRGSICDFPRVDQAARRFVLDLAPDNVSPGIPRRLYLSWFDVPAEIQPGERWQFRVRLKPPRGLRNPGSFDFEEWLFLQGIGATGYVRNSTLNRLLPPDPWACPVAAWRGRLAQQIQAAIPDRPATPYVLGLVVGATSGLTQQDWDLMRRTGTTHLLAISGMNIAMVAAPLLLLGSGVRRVMPSLGLVLPAGVGLLPALLAAGLYTGLAGFAVSTVRSLVMLLMAALYLVRGRPGAPLDFLMLAAAELVVADPSSVRSASFWLSFIAVALLLLAIVPPPVREADEGAGASAWRRWPAIVVGHARALCNVQLVLGAGLAPLTLAWFQQVSLISPLTNLLAVPLFSFLILPLCLVGTAFLGPAPGFGALLLRWAADSLEFLLGGLRGLSALPWAIWSAPPLEPIHLVFGALGAAGVCWRRPLPGRWQCGLLLLPLIVGAGAATPAALRVVVLDVGQGLAVLIQTGRHALLYDAGPAFGSRDAGSSVIIPALRRLGVHELDAMVISHPDMDHRGGAPAMISAFPDARLIAGERWGLPAERYQRCQAGLSWTWDSTEFRVLSPDPADGHRWSENDSSCVLLVRAPGVSVLLPGDVERGRERNLGETGRLQEVDLVVAPHHGSRSSSTQDFINSTRPRYVVFSTGFRNRWRFPAAQVQARWREGGACLLNTADTGAVMFEAAAEGLHLIRRERFDAPHLWTMDGSAVAACEG